jgi:hypothetical protein
MTQTSTAENRKKLAYPSQRVAFVILLRKIVRAVRDGRIAQVPEDVATKLSPRHRIKIRDLVSTLRMEHNFRESVMLAFGLPQHLKFPAGMDTLLFEGELDFDIRKDILLQNIYVSSSERQDIKDFYNAIASKVVDMTVVMYE